VHDIDLVALQIAIAEGRLLPDRPPAAVGHSIEARLYAEDPAAAYLPAAGRVHRFEVPGVDAAFGRPRGRANPQGPPVSLAPPTRPYPPFLRLDSGVEAGSDVPAHYDAMLAKVISWAPSREEAARRLATALAGARIAGPPTNRDLLVSVLRDSAFRDGGADTSLLDGYDMAGIGPDDQACQLSALAAAVAVAAANRQAARVNATVPGGFRNVPSQPQRTAVTGPRGRIDVAYTWTRTGITPADWPGSGDVAVIAFGPDLVTLEVAGVRYRFYVHKVADVAWVDSPFGSVRLELVDRLPTPQAATEPGSLLAPMPGNVVRLAAAAGERVASGQVVLVLEAMKMEHQICAPATGVLAELRVGAGTQVNAGDVLAVVNPDEPVAMAATKGGT